MSQPNSPEQPPPTAVVMQMITGHWVSQLVGSLCRLGIPDALAAMVAGEVASLCDFSKAKKIVDVGGSHGTLLTAVLKKNLGTSGIVIDMPNVAERARKALQASGLGGRAEAVGGDFFVDVPEGDVYLIKQILHDWNDDQCRTILADAFHISDH
jgi:hypothetical protein